MSTRSLITSALNRTAGPYLSRPWNHWRHHSQILRLLPSFPPVFPPLRDYNVLGSLRVCPRSSPIWTSCLGNPSVAVTISIMQMLVHFVCKDTNYPKGASLPCYRKTLGRHRDVPIWGPQSSVLWQFTACMVLNSLTSPCPSAFQEREQGRTQDPLL